MNPRLLERTPGPNPLREIPLTGDQFLIGRGNDCDLRLHNSEISRHHCLLRMNGQEISIADLGSANGTYVNGTRALSQTTLRTGDEVALGPCSFVVDLGDDPQWSERFMPTDIDPVATTSRVPPSDLARKVKGVE